MNEFYQLWITRILSFITIIIIVIFIYYYLSITNYESNQCSTMDNLYPNLDGNLRSINPNDSNCKLSLKDYYIKTAYNSCSGGNYSNDFVNVCNLKDIIKQGVRGLDFEIFSINDNPVVATSTKKNFHIKETYNFVKFNDVMNTIVNFAFTNNTCPNPDDPIIIHLRIKSTSQKMYDNFSDILKFYESYLLGKEFSYNNYNRNLGDIKLLYLLKKIVIIVDRSNTSFIDNTNFSEFVNMTSNSTFMRALSYDNITHSNDLNELLKYNINNMTISLCNMGSNPSNPNSSEMRNAGVQMVAMRYQYVDQFLTDNTNFFDKSGYAFVLKPENLRVEPPVINVISK